MSKPLQISLQWRIFPDDIFHFSMHFILFFFEFLQINSFILTKLKDKANKINKILKSFFYPKRWTYINQLFDFSIT